MTEFTLWQLQHYKQRISEVTDPAAKSFLRKTYYQLSKSNPDGNYSNHCNAFIYSGSLPISHYAGSAEGR